MDQRRTWQLVALATGLAAGGATRWILGRVWRAVDGEEPPTDPPPGGRSWAAALTWAIASGAALAVARIVAERGAAEAWKTAAGSYPAAFDDPSS